MDLLLYGKDLKYKPGVGGNSFTASYQGIMEKINESYIRRDIKTLSARTRKAVEPYLTMMPCPLCKGARLSQAALNCKIKGYNIAQLSDMQVDELIKVLKGINLPEAAPLLEVLTGRLQELANIGLEYLGLSREVVSIPRAAAKTARGWASRMLNFSFLTASLQPAKSVWASGSKKRY